MQTPPTLLHLLRKRADARGDDLYARFLLTGDVSGPTAELSFAELDRRARQIAGHLQGLADRGDRVLLIYPPGLDYITAFAGCLHAGLVAVPAWPPDPVRLDRTLPRLRAIAADAGAEIVLAPGFLCQMAAGLAAMDPALSALRWVATDAIPEGSEDDWTWPDVTPEDIAFLQYTSGSTGSPKGVMVSNRNLLANAAVTKRAFRLHEGSCGVIWLPAYHDMGLIGGIIQPLFTGFVVNLLSPLDFLRRPIRWMEAVHHFRGTITGGPDFALRLVARKSTDQDLSRLDLSCLDVLFTGAEPVRAESLQRFTERFAPCGLQRRTLYPTYGLAEATLQVSGYSGPARAPRLLSVDRAALGGGRAEPPAGPAQTLVSCNPVVDDHQLLIVDPQTLTPCFPGQVGEIWLQGPSVARGYWNDPEANARAFQAHTADGSGPWLRSGDLGFLHDEALFVCGRLKDLIILRGRNVHPGDLELSAQRAHPRVRPGCVAAVGVEIDGEEQILLMAEVDDRGEDFEPAAVARCLRSAVQQAHDVALWGVALVKRGDLPKTSSGKLRRRACRQGYVAGSLAALFQDELPAAAPHGAARAPVPEGYDETLAALRALAAGVLGRAPAEVDPTQPLRSFGMDSLRLVELVNQAEARFQRPLETALLFRFSTLQALARHLSAGEAPSPSSRRGEAADEPIAIIGIGCRFPGQADSPERLWQLLMEGRDAITEVPLERWDLDTWYDPDPAAPGKISTRWGGFVEGIRDFEPSFFGISPVEARNMDPQQRLLLELSWEALENAGIRPGSLSGSNTGVFVGISSHDHSLRDVPTNAYTGTGSVFSVAAGRVSYVLGLEGPSMAIDTACSSSLVSVHLACQALQSGESDLVLAGGVNALLYPDVMIFFSKLRAMSPTGRCRTFDASADGYVRSDGCGVVVLKRLSDARRDGDRVLALIRGSAINQDGRSNGLTAPSGRAQEAVQRAALRRAGLEPEDIDYVEAHGTGTPLGDPVEVQAIAAVHAGRRRPLPIGSIKTQIGHAEAAAGVAGLIKATLALEAGVLPANLHFSRPNPRIPWGELPVEVVQHPRPFGRPGQARRIGVSAFGFGGTNAHVILEQAPPRAPRVERAASGAQRPVHPLVLSARSPAALRALAARLLAQLSGERDDGLPDLCHTLATGREAFPHRFARMVRSVSEAQAALAPLVEGLEQGAAAAEAPGLAFLFTGQGAQHPVMARELYDSHPIFRESIDALDALMAPQLDRALTELLFDPEAPVAQTIYTQPLLFAVELALAELWRSWGVIPRVVVGHSVGELAAACFAGILSREDAARLVVARGRRMQALPGGGAMVSVNADEATLRAALTPYAGALEIAALNAPEQVVISGEAEAAGALISALARRGIPATRLEVSHAFHSARMDPALGDLAAQAAGLVHHPARLPMALTCAEAPMGPAYWPAQARGRVRFAAGLSAALEHGVQALIEVGPQPVLLSLAAKGAGRGLLCLPSLRRSQSDWAVLGGSLCRLFEAGVDIDWRAFDAPWPRQRRQAPTVAFQREPCWIEEIPGLARGVLPTDNPLLGARLDLAGQTAWESSLSTARLPWLEDHRVVGAVVLPASGWIELLRAGAAELMDGVALSGLRLERMLRLEPGQTARVQVVVEESGAGHRATAYVKRSDGGWIPHARAEVTPAATPRPATASEPVLAEMDLDDCYAELAAVGLEYGPSFQGLTALSAEDGIARAEICLPERARQEARAYGIHPALLDAAFQAASALTSSRALFLPVGAERVVLYSSGATRARVALRRSEAEGGGLRVDLLLSDEAGGALAEVAGLQLQPVDPALLHAGRPARERDTAFALGWAPAPPPEGYVELDGRWMLRGDGAIAERLRLRLTDHGAKLRGGVFIAEDPAADPQATCLALAGLCRDLLSAGGAPLLIVTRGEGPAQAALWGLGRSLMQEHPELDCRLVALDAAAETAQAARCVIGEAKRLDGERQISWSSGRRQAARLLRADDGRLAVPDSADWYLVQTERGVLDALSLAPRERRPPGPGEVEIAVEACGLNFRDVLNALGMYPGPAGPLGGECAGRVVAVGEGVAHVALGEPVMALAPAAFGRFLTTDARLVVRRPGGLSAVEAATVPVTFLTAWYALHDLAALEAGERLLVHAAAGGVGMAAVQIARTLGAEVFGTASRPKWPAARANGAAQVFSSRDLSFGPAIEAATAGEGVDVVLNALTGDFLRESFRILGEGGRFIELGKAELLDAAQIRALHGSALYRAFDLSEVDPDRLHEMLLAVAEGIEAGLLRPLPRRVFALSEAVQAFRFMSQARHVGKIVLSQDSAPLQVDPTSTVLLTGAFGGLGRLVARWLVDRGARRLVFTARTPPDAERRAFVESLAPAEVEVVAMDLQQAAPLESLVAALLERPAPLRGVIHAAGALSDGLLSDLSAERFAATWAPKLSAAQALDQATRGHPLDFFVLFSSIAGSLGSAGQANYAAANAALDALARERQSVGEPAVSIAWGPWAGAGMAARLEPMARQRLARQGLLPLQPDQGLRWLERAIRRAQPTLVVAPLALGRLGRLLAGRIPPILSALLDSRPQETIDLSETLATVAPSDRHARMLHLLQEQTARVMGVQQAGEIDAKQPLRELGLDSLMAVDLHNALSRAVGEALPETTLLDHPTLNSLAEALLQRLNLDAAPAEPPSAEGLDADLVVLGGPDARDLLSRELSELEEMLS